MTTFETNAASINVDFTIERSVYKQMHVPFTSIDPIDLSHQSSFVLNATERERE